MLLDAPETASDQPLRATVCVVGSGPSGLVLARRLIETGIDVVVLEAGPLNPVTRVSDRLALPVQYGSQPKKLEPSIAQQVGGTSGLWHGGLAQLDAIDFRRRSWIPHSGWPISAEDLEPFYGDAAAYCHATNPELLDRQALPPQLEALLAEMPFDRNLLENKILLIPVPPKRFRDDALGYLSRSKRARLVYQARAVELLTASNAARIGRVLYLAPDGSRRSVEADYLVLSGGAYQNPRLLLNSRAVWADGIGNQAGLVGRYLADHPRGILFQVRLRTPLKAHIYADLTFRAGQRIRSALRITDAWQEAKGLPNHAFYLLPSFAQGIDNRTETVKLRLLNLRSGRLSAPDFWYVVTNANLIAQIAAYKLSLNVTYRLADLLFVCEQVPNPESRVSLAHEIGPDGYQIARADWRLCSADFDSVAAMYDVLVGGGLDRQVFEAVHRRSDLAWSERVSSAAHHLGTCRMAAAPSAGVIDPDLKVFGTENLYVCDGSVFSTAGNANPTLTAGALALRLAKHLAGRIGRPATTVAPRRTPPLTIAITGASGFMGRNFIERWAAHFAAIRAIGRTVRAAFERDGVTRHACPLDDTGALREAFAGCDAVVHLAYQPANAAWNLAALRALVRAAHDAKVRRIVHVSTIAVYDQSHMGPLIEEDERARTSDDYSVVKRRLETEFVSLAAHYRISGVIIQPTIVYGWPGNWTVHAADVAKYERAILPEAGRGVCNAVHVDDVGAAIQRALTVDDAVLAEVGETPCFLISGPEPVAWAQFYAAHAEMLRRLGLPEQVSIESRNSWRRYHDDPKKDLLYRALYEGVAGRLALPLMVRTRRLLQRGTVSGAQRATAALERLAAPPRRGAWSPTGLGRATLQTRYRVRCDRAARFLGYRPELDLAAGIAATEEAVRSAMRGDLRDREAPAHARSGASMATAELPNPGALHDAAGRLRKAVSIDPAPRCNTQVGRLEPAVAATPTERDA
jgi:choline dehydrogenase-like flavoprotein/nucleoside-diphosphate-sugar epimerase